MVSENNIIVINFDPHEENKSWEKREAHKVDRKEYKRSDIYIRELKNRDFVSAKKVEEIKEKKNKDKQITDDLDKIKLFIEHEEKRNANYIDAIERHKCLMNLITLKRIVKDNVDYYPSRGEVDWVLKEIDRIYDKLNNIKQPITTKKNVTTPQNNVSNHTQILTRLENPRIQAIKLYLTNLENLIKQGKSDSIDKNLVQINFKKIDDDIKNHSFLYKYESNLVKQRLRMKYIKEALLLECQPSDFNNSQQLVDYDKFAVIRVTNKIKDNYKIGQLLEFRKSLINLYVDININYYKFYANEKLLAYQIEVMRIIKELSLVIDQFSKQKTYRALKIIDYIRTIKLIKKSHLVKGYMYQYLAHNLKLIRHDLTNKADFYKKCDDIRSLTEQIDNLDKTILGNYNSFLNVTFRNATAIISKSNELCFKKIKPKKQVTVCLNNLHDIKVKLAAKISIYGESLPIKDYISKIDALIEILNKEQLSINTISNVQKNCKQETVSQKKILQSDRMKKVIIYTKQIRYMLLHYAISDNNKTKIINNLNLILQDFIDNKEKYFTIDGIKNISIHTSELLTKLSTTKPCDYFTERYVKVCTYIGKVQAILEFGEVCAEEVTTIKQNLTKILEDIQEFQSKYIKNVNLSNGSKSFNCKLYLYNITKYINLLINNFANEIFVSSNNSECNKNVITTGVISEESTNNIKSERIKKVIIYNRQIKFLLKSGLITEFSKMEIINNLNQISEDLSSNKSKYLPRDGIKTIRKHTIELTNQIKKITPNNIFTERNVKVCTYLSKVNETIKEGEVTVEDKIIMKNNLMLILKDIEDSKEKYSKEDNINQRKSMIKHCLDSL